MKNPPFDSLVWGSLTLAPIIHWKSKAKSHEFHYRTVRTNVWTQQKFTVWNHCTLKVKLQRSSIWYIMFSKWPTKDPANNEGVKRKEEMNMTAQYTAETAEHRLSRDKT